MNVLLVGSGGREHALAYQINKSNLLDKLYVAPGNPGTASFGENVNIKAEDKIEMLGFCHENKIDLVIIGPEQPLVSGVSDYLRANGFKVFGPDAQAAEIEGNKSFAKELMRRYNIPTAAYKIFNRNEYERIAEYLMNVDYPLVIKASGLAAGKGVTICNNKVEAQFALNDIFINNIFGASGDIIVIEEFMRGQEASIFAVTDGVDFVCLPAAQDHKRIGDNDTGKNTGGMGSYAPAPLITSELQKKIESEIIKPTLDALFKEKRKFVGCLYAGLMITEQGPKVVEFNCRFGDPETQAVVPLLKGDFLQLLYSAADGSIDKNAVQYNGGAAICVVASSEGYPDHYEKGFEIKGLNNTSDDILVFQAGTKQSGSKILTNGGRVLGVTAVTKDNDLSACKQKVYAAIKDISFENIYYRSDIADKGIL